MEPVAPRSSRPLPVSLVVADDAPPFALDAWLAQYAAIVLALLSEPAAADAASTPEPEVRRAA